MTDSPIRGRGAFTRPAGRFASTSMSFDALHVDDLPDPGDDTRLQRESIRSIISKNSSPDIGFEQSINPYRGCEHGCIYCYARPAHAYVDLSPGLDFETRIFYKPDAAAVLRAQLNAPAYRCKTIALGANTDAYQPAEKKLRIARGILEVLAEHRHPVAIVTKSALIERDLDILRDLARDQLVRVMISVTTLDTELKRRMEPRTAGPARRLSTIGQLADAGIPVGVMFAPVIPGLNDHELEQVLQSAAAAGAARASYTLLRLPHEVDTLFEGWLAEHYPLRAAKVLSLVQQMRGGRRNDARFGTRMKGTGNLAMLLRSRFLRATREFGLNRAPEPALNTNAFVKRDNRQLQLI